MMKLLPSCLLVVAIVVLLLCLPNKKAELPQTWWHNWACFTGCTEIDYIVEINKTYQCENYTWTDYDMCINDREQADRIRDNEYGMPDPFTP